MDSTTVTSKGQVTIPRDVRRQMGIRRGSHISFKVRGDHAELRVARGPVDVPASGFGMLKTRKRAIPADFDAATLLRRARTRP